ncbi:hypothetical protein GS462_26620 [Rhodococcus hoagii]|nr:hypothetical protein [Prescottella equi]
MSQLTKLIDAASGEESIATVVRKLYVLARRAGAADLEAWAVKELNGYEASDPLPTYRGPIPVNPLGLFIDGFGGKIKNVAMPSMHVPEEVRERLYTVRLYERWWRSRLWPPKTGVCVGMQIGSWVSISWSRLGWHSRTLQLSTSWSLRSTFSKLAAQRDSRLDSLQGAGPRSDFGEVGTGRW